MAYKIDSMQKRNSLSSLIEKHHLGKHRAFLEKNLAYSIGIEPIATEPEAQERIPVLSSIGGYPLLPEELLWPDDGRKPLLFIAQISLEELPEKARLKFFPKNKSGLLSFFYNDEVWGFNKEDRKGFRVLYFPDLNKLKRRSSPPRVMKKSFLGLGKKEVPLKSFKPFAVNFFEQDSLPYDPDNDSFNDEEWDNYYELIEELGSHHRLFGHSEPIQSDMLIECECMARGLEKAPSENSPEFKEMERAATRWQLLLQIDSDTTNSDMMWGDAGRLYFFIPEEELQAGSFENYWMISQCH